MVHPQSLELAQNCPASCLHAAQPHQSTAHTSQNHLYQAQIWLCGLLIEALQWPVLLRLGTNSLILWTRPHSLVLASPCGLSTRPQGLTHFRKSRFSPHSATSLLSSHSRFLSFPWVFHSFQSWGLYILKKALPTCPPLFALLIAAAHSVLSLSTLAPFLNLLKLLSPWSYGLQAHFSMSGFISVCSSPSIWVIFWPAWLQPREGRGCVWFCSFSPLCKGQNT